MVILVRISGDSRLNELEGVGREKVKPYKFVRVAIHGRLLWRSQAFCAVLTEYNDDNE